MHHEYVVILMLLHYSDLGWITAFHKEISPQNISLSFLVMQQRAKLKATYYEYASTLPEH